VYPEQVWYGGVTVGDVDELIEQHLLGGKLVDRLLMKDQPHLAGAGPLPAIAPPGKPEPK
jgi:(2Fe-2S) ferredoxin